MGRQRMVKPELFVHEHLYESEKECGLPLRLAFIGLWTQCDRDGRFEWRPMRLKLSILPWDSTDFADVLNALEKAGFVKRYEVDGHAFGHIPSWHKHQRPHDREAKSVIPGPEGAPKANLGRAQGEPEESQGNGAPVQSLPESEYGIRNTESVTESEGAASRPSAKKFDPASAEIPMAIDTQAFRAAWAEWCAYRAKKRKPISEDAAVKQLAQLTEHGEVTAIKAIESSIANDWQGLFPEKIGGKNGSNGKTGHDWQAEAAKFVAGGRR